MSEETQEERNLETLVKIVEQQAARIKELEKKRTSYLEFTKIRNGIYEVKGNKILLGEIYQDYSQIWYWEPIHSQGCWLGYHLREIADKIEELNSPA